VRRELERQGKDLVVQPEVVDFIAREGYSVEYGARNIARVLKKELLERIAHASLEKEWDAARTVAARMSHGVPEIRLAAVDALWDADPLWQEQEQK